MTTYSNLGIALIGTGEESGTWGTVTNSNLQFALQEPIANSVDVAVTGGGVTDTMAWNASSNASQPARFLRLKLTGSGGGSGNLVVPTLSEGKNYIVDNASDSIITVKTSSGGGVAIDPGDSRSVYQDGTNVVLVERYTGAVTFSTVNATDLAVSGNVTGAGFTARFAAPGPIGNVTPSTGFFSSLSATGNITLGDDSGDLVTFNSGTAAIPNNLILDGTGSLTLPKGTVAQRPTPVAGMIRYNTDDNELEIYTGSSWEGAPTDTSVTALIDAAIVTAKSALYPVGSIYTNASVNTNPGTLLGFGTWVAYGEGRVVIGTGGSFTNGATGGSADINIGGTTDSHTLTIDEMPEHNHPNDAPDAGGGALNYLPASGNPNFTWGGGGLGGQYGVNSQGGGQGHTHGITYNGTDANYQPYIVAYMWKRTA